MCIFSGVAAAMLLSFNIMFNHNLHHSITRILPTQPTNTLHTDPDDIPLPLSISEQNIGIADIEITNTTHSKSESPHSKSELPHNPTDDGLIAITKTITNALSRIDPDPNALCSYLICNDLSFALMQEYASTVSSIGHPLSIHTLNEQLFCPLKHSSTLNPSTSMISSAGERLLRFIHSNQFKTNCHDPSIQYLIYDTTGWYTGLGATTNGGILKYFTRSLMSNRTFILVGSWEWSKDLQHCIETGREGFGCYFLPPSNCKYADIIQNVDVNDETQYRRTKGVPKDCNLGDFPDKQWCPQRVMYIEQNGAGWYPKNEDIDRWINSVATNHFTMDNELLFSNYPQYKAAVISFMYRLQPNVRHIVYDKVRSAILKSFDSKQAVQHQFDPLRTVGFPIRASDKCNDNEMGLHGEMECWSVEELCKLLNAIHTLQPAVSTVILTSEDMHVVEQVIEKLREETYEDGFEWNVVINHDDSKPAIGMATFRDHEYQGVEVDKTTDSDFEHDVIVGALSSLLLQTANSKYIVHTKSSSWLNNLWNIGAQLDCGAIFWSQEMEINGFHDNDGMPSFLRSTFKRYATWDKMCIELKQQGLLNKKVREKHVKFPPDLWEQIHVLNLDGDRFRERFGFDILEDGWNSFCERWTKYPFVLDDDVGV